jgi:hypothetical protein
MPYHLTMTRLGTGSVIQPGNWGRLIRKYENGTDRPSGNFGGNLAGWMIAREMVFELERIRGFADKPSRLESTFSFRDRDHAERYRQAHDVSRAQVLHEVEFINPTSPTHEAAVSLLDWPPNNHSFLVVMTNMALEYWRGASAGTVREVVSHSPLRVRECLE